MSKGENKKESQVLSPRGHNSGKGERYPISHQEKILTEGFPHGNPSPWDSSVSLLPALAFMSIWSSPGWSLVLQEDAFYKKVLEELIYYHRIKNAVMTTSVADVIGGVRGVIPTSHLAQYGDFRYDLEAEMLYTPDEPHRVATEGCLRTRDSSCADFSGQRRNSDWRKPCDIGADVTNDVREERPLLWEPWDANRRGRGELFLHPIVNRTMDKLTNAKKERSKVDQDMDEWVQELRNLLCDLRTLAARNKRAAGAWIDRLIDMCTRFLSTVNVNPALCELLHSDMPLIINYDQIFYEPISREEVLAIPQPLLPEDPLEDTDEVRHLWVRISSPEVRLLWLPLHEASMFGQLPNPLTCTLGRSDRVVVVTSFLLKDDVDDDNKNTKVSSSSNKAVVIEEDQAKHYLGSLVDILNKDQLKFLENCTEKFSSRWEQSTPSLRKPSLPKFFFPQAHGYWNRELFPYQLSSASSSPSSLPGERSLTPDAAIPTQDPTINPIERQQNLSLNDASTIKSQVETYLLVIKNWLDNYKQEQEQMHSQSSLSHQQQLLTSKFFNSSQPPENQFWNPVNQSQENHPPKANPMGREQFSKDQQFTHGHLSQQNSPIPPFPSMDQMSFFARYPPPSLTHRFPTTTSTGIPSHPYYQQHSNAEHQFRPAHQPITMPPTSSYFHPPIQRSGPNTLSQHPTEKSKFLPQNTSESNLQQRFISEQRYGVSSNWPPSPSELPEGRSYANMKNQFQEQHQTISRTFPSYGNNVPSIPKINAQEVDNFPQVKHSVPENSLELNFLKNLQRPKGSDEIYYQQFQHPVQTSISKPVPTEFLRKTHPRYTSAQKQTYSQVCNLPPLHSQSKDDSCSHGWQGRSDWFHSKQTPCQQTNALSSFLPGPDTWKLQASENKDQMHSNQRDFIQGLDLHSKCYDRKPEQNQMNRIKPEKCQSMKQNSQAIIDNTSLDDRKVWRYPLPTTQEGLTSHFSGSNVKKEPLSAHSVEWPQLPSYDASAGFSQEPVQPVNSAGCCNEEARKIQVLVKNRKKKKGRKEINRYLVGIQRARHEPNKQIHRKKISSQKNGKAKPKIGEYKSPYKKINGHVAQRNGSNHILMVDWNSATKHLQEVLNYKKKSYTNFTNNTYIVDANESDSYSYGDTTDPSSSTSEKLLKLFEESISSEKSSDVWLGNSEERVEPELKSANESVKEVRDKYHSWSSGDEANPSNHPSNYKEHKSLDDDSLYASTKVKEEYKAYLRNDSADQVKRMNESKCKKITYHPPYALSSKSSNPEHASLSQSLSTSYNDSFTDIFTKEQMNRIKDKVFNSENPQIMRENSSEDYLNRDKKENYDLHSVDDYSTHDLLQNQDSVEQSRSTSGSIISLTISSPSYSFLYSRDDDDDDNDDKTSGPIIQSLIDASSYLEDYPSDLSTKKDFVTSTPVKHSIENVHSGSKRKLSEIKNDDFGDIINPLMKRLRLEMDKEYNDEKEGNRSRENGCSQKIPVAPNNNTDWCNSIKTALITIVRDVLCYLISEQSENDSGISAEVLSKYFSTTDIPSKQSCSNSFVLNNSKQMDRGNGSTVRSENASIKNSSLENRTLTRRHRNGLFGKTNCCRTDKNKPMDAGNEAKLNDASYGENGNKDLKLGPHCRSRHSMVNASGPNGKGRRVRWQNVNNGIKEHSLVNHPEQRTFQSNQDKNFTSIVKAFGSCSLSGNIAKRPRNNKLCAMMSNLHTNPYFKKPQFTEMKKRFYPLSYTNSSSSSVELKPFGSRMIISGSSSSLYTPDKSSCDDSYYTAPISPRYS